MSRARTLVLLLGLALGASLLSPAAAQSSPDASRPTRVVVPPLPNEPLQSGFKETPCIAAEVLRSELDDATVRTIENACRTGGWFLADGDLERLKTAIRILSLSGGWKVALLYNLVRGAGWSSPTPSDEFRAALRQSKNQCGNHSAMLEYARTVGPVKAPIRADSWAKECPAVRDGQRVFFSVYSASSPSLVTVFVGGQDPYFELSDDGMGSDGHAPRREGIPLSDSGKQLGTFHVFYVPRNTPATAVIERPGSLPVFRNLVVSDDAETSADVPMGCINFELTQNPDAMLLIDGVRIGGKTLPSTQFLNSVPASTPHDVVVLSSDRVLNTQQITPKQIRNADRCDSVRMDLSDEPIITLIGATTSPMCADAGVTQGTLALRVTEYLSKAWQFSHKRFRDYAGWADIAENFTGYREKLLHIGGMRVGADTGNLATDVQLGSAAQELLRKGMEVLLTVDLSCTPHPVRHGDWVYAFQVHKIDLKKLVEGPSDSRQGLTVDGVLETDSETVQSQSDLYRAVATPIARLLDIPYVRFIESPATTKFYSDIRLEFESFLPGRSLSLTPTDGDRNLGPACPTDPNKNATKSYDIELRAELLDRKNALETCSELDADRRLKSGRALRPHSDVPSQSEGFQDEIKTTVTADCKDDLAQPIRGELSLYPRKGGTYLVELATIANVEGREHEIATDFRCVDVEEPSQHMWLQLGYQWDFHESVDKSESTNVFEALGGMTIPNTQVFSVGGVVGYTFAQHQGLTPPTWQDGLAAQALPDGTIPYSWTRHALVVGPVFSLEGLPGCRPSSPCRVDSRRWQLLATFMPLLDAGLIFPDDQAVQFTRYVADRAGAPIFDPRVTLILQGGASRRYDETHDLAILMSVQQSGGGIFDFRKVFNWSEHRIGDLVEWTAGFSLQAGWGR